MVIWNYEIFDLWVGFNFWMMTAIEAIGLLLLLNAIGKDIKNHYLARKARKEKAKYFHGTPAPRPKKVAVRPIKLPEKIGGEIK